MFKYITYNHIIYSSTLDKFLGISENVTLPQMYQKRNQNLGCLQIYQKRNSWCIKNETFASKCDLIKATCDRVEIEMLGGILFMARDTVQITLTYHVYVKFAHCM